jgi:putative tryptophan/tyrosine transport system substrate-binding protein
VAVSGTWQATSKPRLAFLGAASAQGYSRQLEGFRLGLRDFGYDENNNVVIDYRWAEGRYERLLELALELIRWQPGLIVTHGTPASFAARKASSTIPIVMAIIGDPVATGVVASEVRPGGNISTQFAKGFGSRAPKFAVMHNKPSGQPCGRVRSPA